MINDFKIYIPIHDERILIVAVIASISAPMKESEVVRDSSIFLLCVSLLLLFGQGLFVFLYLSCDFKDYFRPSPIMATSLWSAGWSWWPGHGRPRLWPDAGMQISSVTRMTDSIVCDVSRPWCHSMFSMFQDTVDTCRHTSCPAFSSNQGQRRLQELSWSHPLWGLWACGGLRALPLCWTMLDSLTLII